MGLQQIEMGSNKVDVRQIVLQLLHRRYVRHTKGRSARGDFHAPIGVSIPVLISTNLTEI